MEDVLIPDPAGGMRRVSVPGPAGGYISQALLGWLFTLITLGIYLPWYRTSTWKWIAGHSQVLEPNAKGA